jgi:PKHD-type hydroxylase
MRYTYNPPVNSAVDFYQFDSAFNIQELNAIERGLQGVPYTRATMEGGHQEDRKSNIKWIPHTEEWDWLYIKLMELAGIANNECWNFDLTSAPEMIQYTEYDSAELGKYDWHQDIGPNDLSFRKVSMTVQLSADNEYEGGELCFWKGGESLETNYDVANKGIGNVVVFPSYLVHAVKPVTSGIRKSFVLWLGGGHYK